MGLDCVAQLLFQGLHPLSQGSRKCVRHSTLVHFKLSGGWVTDAIPRIRSLKQLAFAPALTTPRSPVGTRRSRRPVVVFGLRAAEESADPHSMRSATAV